MPTARTPPSCSLPGAACPAAGRVFVQPPRPSGTQRRCASVAAVAVALALASGPAMGDYPALRPLGGLLEAGEAGTGRAEAAAAADALEARATRLIARAEALRAREVIDPPTRARMLAVRDRLAVSPDG